MSTTVLLKGLPPNCSDVDIRRALSGFGNVLEMQMRYATNSAQVKMDTSVLNNVPAVQIQNAIVAVEPLASHAPPSQHQAPSRCSTVRVVVDGCTYPITTEVLQQVFTRFSPNVQIQCGPSGTTTHGTVTFPDAGSAAAAVQSLNKKCIYPGCCNMTLTLAEEVPPPPSVSMPQVTLVPPFGQQQLMQFTAPSGYYAGGFAAPMPQAQPQYTPQLVQPSSAYVSSVPPPPPFRGRGGFAPRGGHGMSAGLGAPGFQEPYAARSHNQYGHHSFHQHHEHHHHHQQHNSHHHTQHLHSVGGNDSAVVIVSGVPESVPLQSLWVLLEVYGNVQSLKRQFSHKTNVVAQFQNLHDARGVLVHLQHCPFFGSTLQLKHFAGYVDRSGSKTEWNSGPATDPGTLAFLFHGSHHRTKPSAPFNPKQKCRPDKYLFVSNLSEEIPDTEVAELFRAKGFTVLDMYRKTPVAAIVSLGSVEEAVEALIAVHATLMNGRYLSVAFSRFPPGPPPAGVAQEDEGQAGQTTGV